MFAKRQGRSAVQASSVSRRILQAGDSRPVLGIDLATEPSIVLDLSIASPMLSGDTRANDEPL